MTIKEFENLILAENNDLADECKRISEAQYAKAIESAYAAYVGKLTKEEEEFFFFFEGETNVEEAGKNAKEQAGGLDSCVLQAVYGMQHIIRNRGRYQATK